MPSRTTAAIILAAGASTRLGRPKQLVQFNHETLLDRAARAARETGLAPILVVLGAFADQIRSHCPLPGCTVIVNQAWQQGMSTSIRLGIETLLITPGHTAGAILTTCDMPFVTTDHLQALSATGRLTASRYDGHPGVPAYFPAALFPALASLSGPAGAKDLLRSAETIDLPAGELDIDTPADVERLHRALATRYPEEICRPESRHRR